jgi:GH25 family lysozyme M1 (1,4-beta-N-acetylmuramidase)
MDPRLVRLFEDGGKNDEVAAILRLGGNSAVPPAARVVSRFGDIATVRLRRGDIASVHDSPSVASMKPAAPLLREARLASSIVETVASRGDLRRSNRLQATGKGVVFGLVDWGFDFAHPDFRDANGGTRLLSMWDQTAPTSATSPAPYRYGAVHSAADINAALASSDPYGALNYNPADSDPDGQGAHGAHVAGIAVGNGRSGGPCGLAPAADIVFVQLTTLNADDPDLADSASVLEAIDFVRGIAGPRPWVVDLSMGQCGDQHDGTTLIEQGLDAALTEAPGRAIAQSAGNYFASRQHSSGRLGAGERRTLTWQVPAADDGNELEIWYSGIDAFTVSLCSPDGGLAGRAALGERVQLQAGGRSCGELNNRRRDPNNLDNHVVVWLTADAEPGDWQVTLDGDSVKDGAYHLWIQRGDDDGGVQAAFTKGEANPFFTTNSICNGRSTIVAGAYDASSGLRDVASFSSSGPTRDGRLKPDLLAPGVGVLSARSTPAGSRPGRGLQVRMTGTSMAAPHVAGTIALMFEAASRPLHIEETRRLLLGAVQNADRAGPESIRYGQGYLDVDAAVEAAHKLATGPGALSRRSSEMAASTSTITAEPTPDGSDTAATADTLIGRGGPFAASPHALVARVLSACAEPAAFDPANAAGLLDPAMLFDAFATARLVHLRRLLDPLFVVVAYPRQFLTSPVQSGDLMLRRALGEPGIGHAAFIADQGVYSCDDAARRGLSPESRRPGLYAGVVEAGPYPRRRGHRFARRIAGPEGRLPPDTLILRPRLRPSPRRNAEEAGRFEPSFREGGGASTASTPALTPEKLKISGLPEITLAVGSNGRYDGFFKTPLHLRPDQTPYAQTDTKDLTLTGRVQIVDSGARRDYDPAKDATDWPLSGIGGSARVSIPAGDDGPTFSSASDVSVKPNATFTFATRIGVGGFTRALTLYPRITFKDGTNVAAKVSVELIDLDGFLALVDPLETKRPASQSHLEFLASVRKIYQGGPKDPLGSAFDQVLFRFRNVSPLVAPGSASEARFKLYGGQDGLFADTDSIDIGHVLTGIEGSPRQDPTNLMDPNTPQNLPAPPPRRELIVTWVGDLGSAIQNYIRDFWTAVDTGTPLDLNTYLSRFAGRVDLLGDIDGINLGSAYDAALSLAENLRAYYGRKSRRRFHEFIANSKDTQGVAVLPLALGKTPPRLSKQARRAIADNIRSQYLAPLQLWGRLYHGNEPDKRRLVDAIIQVDSPEMDMAVDYFARFLEDGLAREGVGPGESAAEKAGGAAAPVAPPVPVKDLPLGFDINQDNGDRTEGLTEFKALKTAGKAFGIEKIAQGAMDVTFDVRYPLIRDAGMIRGSYDFFAPIDVEDQIQFVVDHVKRLTPGDLAPAIDLEDQSAVLDGKYQYSAGMKGRQALFDDVSKWLTAVETRLGRPPIVYTGVLWREQFSTANFPNLPNMDIFPLWTAHPIPTETDDTATGEVFNGWSTYTFWQYAEDKRGDKKNGKPGTKLWGIDPYVEAGTERFDGIDYDAFNGSINGLRGLADLGHTAPHLAGDREYIAYSAPSGEIHLLELAGNSWNDQNLSSAVSSAPLAQGDPAAIGVGNEQIILYRTKNGQIYALSRTIGAAWTVSSVGKDAIDDPFVLRIQNNVHAVYWNTFNQQVHLFRPAGGSWQSELAADPNALPPPEDAAGSAVAYPYQNACHFVSRAGPDGHLIDIFRAAGLRPYEDLTSTPSDAKGNPPPPATYRPTTYAPPGAAPRIVFRAVRGSIWQVERDTLAAKNLTTEASAPVSAGSPSAIYADTCRIFYRGTDGAVDEIFERRGKWVSRLVCAFAAADPTGYIDGQGHAAVSFLGNEGVWVGRLVNDAWTCARAK